MDEIYVVPGVF